MEERLIFNEEFYKKATKQLEQSKSFITSKVNENTFKNDYLMQLCIDEINKVNQIMLMGFVDLTVSVEERQKEIKRTYEQRVSYFEEDIKIEPLKENAGVLETQAYEEKLERAKKQKIDQAVVKQAQYLGESLKRQDFDLKVDVMEDNEVEKFVLGIAEGFNQVSVYEFNVMRKRVKEVESKEIKRELQTVLSSIAIQENIDNAWENDEEWQKVERIKFEINTLPKNAIFEFNQELNDWELKDIEYTIYSALNMSDAKVKDLSTRVKANRADKQAKQQAKKGF